MTLTDGSLKLNIPEYDRLKSKLNLTIEFIASVYTIEFKCQRLIYMRWASRIKFGNLCWKYVGTILELY